MNHWSNIFHILTESFIVVPQLNSTAPRIGAPYIVQLKGGHATQDPKASSSLVPLGHGRASMSLTPYPLYQLGRKGLSSSSLILSLSSSLSNLRPC
jgi:hypothetical protein